MTIKLVSVSPDAEKTMAHIARVSNPENQDNPKYAGLLLSLTHLTLPTNREV